MTTIIRHCVTTELLVFILQLCRCTGQNSPVILKIGLSKFVDLFINGWLIAVRRKGSVPQTLFDHDQLGVDFIENYELTTALDMTNMLKLNSTMGELYAKNFFLYTRLTNKTLKPTQNFSMLVISRAVVST